MSGSRDGRSMATQEVHPDLPRLTYSADEVAALLGISRAKVYDAIHGGQIPCVRFGRRIVVPARALRALVGDDG
jgi:excisionase family DNA binding protein